MPSGSESTTPTTSPNPTPTSNDAERNMDNINSIESTLSRSTSHDPTAYVQRARVTRAAPPKPACNPLQFIQIKPCNLYQSAQEQLKRAEEIKKVKETKKEEPEDWQSNLDNWKSCRRKRVEHIIDRVVEVKKLELEEHDRARKKSKTFSEMMEERNTKGRKVSLAVYVDDEANDLSDLGIGTSTASGKSSLSEDFDNNSVLSDNQDNEKSTFDIDNQGNDNGTREYVSSPGYDTSSTHPPSSPDLCEYTYEGAIQDYKSRVSRAQKCGFTNNFYSENNSKDSNNEATDSHLPRKQTSIQIENRLSNFKEKTVIEIERNENLIKKDLPKVDIARRRELFEKDILAADKQETEKVINNLANDFSQTISIKERLQHLESLNDSQDSTNTKMDCLSTEFASVKDRLLDIEKTSINQNVQPEKNAPIDMPIVSIKHRLSALQDIVPSNTDETLTQLVAPNTPDISSDVNSSDVHTVEINENETRNGNVNNNQEPLSLEHNDSRLENNIVETTTDLQAMETKEEEEQQQPMDAIEEQPNRLLSTINEAIHLVDNQLDNQPENITKRDSSVSLPNLLKTHVFDDIVVDNEVMVIDDLDDTINTNRKSYLVMDNKTSESIVHTSYTDNTRDKDLLTTAGDSLCKSKNSEISISDSCRPQPKDNEISHDIDVKTCLRNPNDTHSQSTTPESLNENFHFNFQIVKPVESNGYINGNGLNNDTHKEVKQSDENEDRKKFCDLHDSNINLSGSFKHYSTDDIYMNVNVGELSLSNQNKSYTKQVEASTERSDSPMLPKESSESKNQRLKCQIVGVLEKHKCSIDATTSRSDLTINTSLTDNFVPSSDQVIIQSPTKSPFKSSKNIFDFIKRNLLNDPLQVTKESDVNSTFYIPLIEVKEAIETQTISCYDEVSEINNLIDEELEKLN